MNQKQQRQIYPILLSWLVAYYIIRTLGVLISLAILTVFILKLWGKL